MAANNDSTAGETTKQGGDTVDDLEQDYGSESKSPNKRGDSAEMKERLPRRQKKRFDHNNRSNGKNSHKPKRRRVLSKKPEVRHIIIPEARVVQGYDECAYISDQEDEIELLPRPNRKIVQAAVEQGLGQEIQHDVVRDDAPPVSFKFFASGGGKRHKKSRCYCFDCW